MLRSGLKTKGINNFFDAPKGGLYFRLQKKGVFNAILSAKKWDFKYFFSEKGAGPFNMHNCVKEDFMMGHQLFLGLLLFHCVHALITR